MTTTARHPGIDRGSHTQSERISRETSRWHKAIGIVGLVVLLWVGDRLYDVISRGSVTPGGVHGPASRTSPTQPTDRDPPIPGGGSDGPGRGGGGHDPSQFGH